MTEQVFKSIIFVAVKSGLKWIHFLKKENGLRHWEGKEFPKVTWLLIVAGLGPELRHFEVSSSYTVFQQTCCTYRLCSQPDFSLHFCFLLGPQEHLNILQIFLLNNFGRNYSYLADRRDPEPPQNFPGVVKQSGGPQQPWFPKNSSVFIPPWIQSMVFFFLKQN